MTTSTPALRDDLVALFPGQGSLSGRAGRPWRDSSHWSIVDEISDAAEVDVAALLLDADDDEVIRTDRAQIATFALSILGYQHLVETGVVPKYLLGHSLGEFSALVASGLISVHDGARLIAVRGRAMAKCAREVPGTMVALMGGDVANRSSLEALVDVWVANINGTGQVVLSGTTQGIEYVVEHHRDLGWRRAAPLPVGGAFHSPLMAPAQEELDAALADVTWGTTDQLLIANVDASVHADAASWRALLSRQLTSPVEFLDATLRLPASVTSTIEMPPGTVLNGLTKRIRDFERQESPASPAEYGELSL